MTTKKDQAAAPANQGVAVEVETTRRLKMDAFTFEETSINGKGAITLSSEGQKARELSDEEVSNFVRFFVGFQRRQEKPDNSADDGRGQVTNASTDARLKGNK